MSVEEPTTPEEAARYAAQGAVDEDLAEPMTGQSFGQSKTSHLFDRLRNTEPHRDLDEIDGLPEINEKWDKMILRGIEKAVGEDRRMAAFDLILGGIGMFQTLFSKNDDEELI